MSETIVKITDQAWNKIKEMRINNEQEGYYFKFAVTGGGCSGLSYQMLLKEKIDEEEVIELDGKQVLINKEDINIIKGTVIDFKQSMMGGGFIIENPNAIVSCGCGSSFKAIGRESKETKCE